MRDTTTTHLNVKQFRTRWAEEHDKTGCAMRKTITRLNIEHFRTKLVDERNETKRNTLLRLLVEEEANLAALMNLPKKMKLGDEPWENLR
jgi:hypothetical protein